MSIAMPTSHSAPAIDPAKVLDLDIYGAFKGRPYDRYVELARSAPFYILIDGSPQAMCTRYEHTREVLEDYSRFSSRKRPWPGTKGFYYFNAMPTVTDSDPPDHDRLRRLMAPAFLPRKLATIQEGVKRAVERRLDEIEQAGRCDLVRDLGLPLGTEILFGEVLNLPKDGWHLFTDLSDAMRAAFSTPTAEASHQAAYEAAWRRARDYCGNLITARTRDPTDDLISDMIRAHAEAGKLTSDELYGAMFVLYTAGIGGLINYPAWTLWRLARHRDQMELLQRDPSLLQGALNEGLRMDPSSFASLRYAEADFEFHGLPLFKDMPVHTLSASGNYDPDKWADPTRFDITRNYDWKLVTSFGHGVHHCIGNGLVRMTTRIIVDQFVRRFPRLRLEDDDFMPEVIGVPKQRAPKSIPVLVD